MSLSICLITADPPARIAAILEPLRPYADEILIAADSRVDDELLAGYAAVADRLFKIEFRRAERHLAWLCSQCSSDWILRLDGDEVPSQAFIRRLPELLASRRVQQYWIPRAWLYPDADRVLACAPWAEDFVNRLMRNDGTLRVSGAQHTDTEPVTPRAYVEEPLYHLDLLTTPRQQRRDKVVCYEVARPHLLAVGGGRINEAFYLPELRDSLEFRPVPDEDRAAITLALKGSHMPSPRTLVSNVPFISLKEMDSMWEGRAVCESAYRASIEPREPRSSLAPSEQRQLFFYVTNEGTERWPARLDEGPPIRLAYRWLNPDGNVHTPEGVRSAFHRRVNPGERIVTPLHVDAPSTPGEYLLEVDVVHEHVRWFDCPCRVPVCVEHPQGLPSTGPRLRETKPPKRRRWRRVRVPRTIHRVWLGDEPMPAEHERFGETFAQHHPGWTMRLWTDDDLAALDITAAERERARTPSELSNLVRYEVLHRFGGVYVDTDFECLRPLTPLLRGIDAFAALELAGTRSDWGSRLNRRSSGIRAGCPADTTNTGPRSTLS